MINYINILEIYLEIILDFLIRENGSFDNTFSGASQHFQQCHNKFSESRNPDSHRDLDVGLYPLCIW